MPSRTPEVSAPIAPGERSIAPSFSILVGGDVNLGRDVGQRLLRSPSYDPLAGVRDLLQSADLVFFNLESPLSHQAGVTRHPHDRNVFTGPPSGADALAAAGVDVVSVANNHSWDYGQEGFTQTIDNLRFLGIRAAGGSLEANGQYAPAVIARCGWSVAFFAVTSVWNPGSFEKHPADKYVAWADVDRLAAEIRRARRAHDLVLVSYHGGREYSLLPTGETRAFARRLMESGADAFIGHHPHVPQGVEWFSGRPIFYSLGNAVFGAHRDEPWTSRSYLMRLEFSKGEAPIVRSCPIVLEHDVPRRPDDEEWAELGPLFPAYLEQSSQRWDGVVAGALDRTGCFRLTPRSEQSH